jgi:type IV pilus assembly protein PilY1
MKTSHSKQSAPSKTQHRWTTFSISLFYILISGQPVLADDTEVLIGPGGQAWATPNILFIMDTSGSMGGVDDANTEPRTRLRIVQDVFKDLMNNNAGFNIALMRFDSGGSGGYFLTPMQTLNSNSRSTIISASENLSANGNTPLSETFYEAALFYSGGTVDYGDSSTPGTNDSGVFNDNDYISPITSQCQRNYSILLTDGAPTHDDQADANIATLTGNSCTGNCLDEIAYYLKNSDQNTTISGKQTVETYTIGFTTNQTLLEDTALAGGGSALAAGGNDHYMTANNADQLSAAFTEILKTITDTNNSFSPPALAANTFNGISNFNRLYFTLFEPAASPKWKGNVKPYRINDNYAVVDADNRLAVDNRGFFLESSRSLWSGSDDGGSISDGGANAKLPIDSNRTLYTYTGSYSASGVPSTPLLSINDNLLNNANNALTADLLALPSSLTTAEVALQRSAIISATRNYSIGAPLHAKPAIVTYGGTENNPTQSLFVATNDGFLHVLNAATGVEQFAFVPQELLPNLSRLNSNTGTLVYGLDGDVSTWVQESDDDDRSIESADGDHVYIYVGMRRGGSNYYALDVTNPSAPALKWVIQGGAGGTAGFEELGQSWSKPIVTTIKYGGSTKKVLIFGGGYDPLQDNNPLNTPDDIGRAVFIVDANSGEKLWQAGHSAGSPDLLISEMANSIPSDIALFDSNLDGYTDRLYVGDMRGQVFRIDLEASSTGISASSLRLANLGGVTEADNRRFFYPPDVVFTQRPGLASYVSVNIGSGYRAHPLNPLTAAGLQGPRVNDRFYSLRDPYVVGAIPAAASITEITDGSGGNLFDATNSLINNSTDIDSLIAATGWYLTLGNGSGEKVLAPAITINGEIFFTTYTPPVSVSQSNCAPPPGQGRLYRVSLFNANPTTDQNGDTDNNDIIDRIDSLERPGIPPSPAIMFRENNTNTVEIVTCQGTECDPLPNAIQIQETYWKGE